VWSLCSIALGERLFAAIRLIRGLILRRDGFDACAEARELAAMSARPMRLRDEIRIVI
jgi:hypothetical protein